MLTVIMTVETVVDPAHRSTNVPNAPVLLEMMILVTVSQTVLSTTLILVIGQMALFIKSNGVDLMINIK